MRVLVIGAYGLIGHEIVRTLLAAGFEVTGFGRSLGKGRRLIPGIPWLAGDLSAMTTPEHWTTALSGMDAVVNASGALQDGALDRLQLAQDASIRALTAACERGGVARYIQISAPGADARSSTAFLRTKAAADAALRASSLDWTILKPGLVIGAGAYGGTALVRMLAAFPIIQPLVLAGARIQTAAASDVADAVRALLAGEVSSRADYDLMEPSSHSLAEIVAAVRKWVGREPARSTLQLPRWLGYGVAFFADVAGWLGWRSPLRTTALKSLEDGVTGDSSPWVRAGGKPPLTLEQTLASLPSTMQERVFGRAQLVYPVLLITLAAFWLVSGVIGAFQHRDAASMITAQVGAQTAGVLVALGSAADIAIGIGLLIRSWVRRAAIASIILATSYLAAGTWLTPHIWADPMGPFVKVLPAIALALAVAALTEDR